MIPQRDYKRATILNAAAATGAGTPVNVSAFRHIVLSFGTADSGNLTVKLQGSISESIPAFGSAQSVANHWDYVQAKDLEDGSTVDGDTGIAVTGTDDFRIFEVNTNGLEWFNAVVTARSAGSVTVKIIGFTD